MTADRLDPDEIPCRTCRAPAGVECRQPSGKLAASLHVRRRRDAAAGVVPNLTQQAPNREPSPRKPSPATPEGRSRGGQTAAQNRRRRAAEAAAAVEQARAEAEAEALVSEGRRLAEDATRYAHDRATLRRYVLDAGLLSYVRLVEGLNGLQRVNVDDEGRPVTRPEEYTDRAGNHRTKEVPDVRGVYNAATVERLAKVAASALQSLRLEEGKPTGITETTTGNVETALGEAGVDELLAWATDNLPGPRPPA